MNKEKDQAKLNTLIEVIEQSHIENLEGILLNTIAVMANMYLYW